MIQDLIDERKLQVCTPLSNPNKELCIYQYSLPHHINNISWNTNQVTHKCDPNYIGYVSMISVSISA